MLTFWNFRVLHPELCRTVRLTTTVTIPTKHHEHIIEVYQIYISSQQPIYRAIGAELKSFRHQIYIWRDNDISLATVTSYENCTVREHQNQKYAYGHGALILRIPLLQGIDHLWYNV